MSALRLLRISWVFQLKMIMRSPFDGFGNVIYPLFFATVAFFVFRAGGGPRTLLYASLGAAVMGMWSSVSTSSGTAMQRERWWGTLELVVSAPRHFSLVLLPATLGLATVGIYNLIATLLWGRLLFGINLSIAHPLLFAFSVIAAVLAFGGLGFLFAVSFVRYRYAWVLGNFFEYPVWLICGFLVPLTLLPSVGAADLMGVRADLGDERDPGVRARRDAAAGPPRLPRARLGVRRGRDPRHRPRAACRARQRLALADMTAAARLFFVGGITSFRALWNWLSPWIYIPTMLISPIFQILLFAYIGRSAQLESDEFYLIGNALQYASIPCLFAMSQMISGERYQNTLSAILVSPAPRIPLFFGRSLPVILNGAFVSAFSLAAGSLILGVHLPASSFAPLALVILVAAFSCTGLGLVNGAVSLRIRENAVLNNVIFGFLLIFTGANVPLDALPDWMSTAAQAMPFTHAIEAARQLVAGSSLGDVSDLLGAELLIGAVYAVLGYSVLRWFETQARRHATLERS